jgi:DNA (cytosine-5)-methyltransferase 1
MIHLGDITKISGYTAPIVDCIIGGSPCQDLSIAGKRAGLDGERSGLFMEQIRIIKEMRKRNDGTTDIRPRYMVWENVPGAFSSNRGEGFRIVLEETAKVADENAVIPEPPKGRWTTSGCIVGDGWSIAWRVLDAQFWGVPQRRRRIALVADFGGHSAHEILFVRKGLPRYTEQSKQKRKNSSEDASGCVGTNNRLGADQYNAVILGDIVSSLGVNCGMSHGRQCVLEPVTYEWHSQDLRVRPIDNGISPTISAGMGMGGASMTCPVLIRSPLYCFEPGITGREGGHIYEGVSGTLRANAGDNQMATVYSVDQGGGKSACNVTEGKTPTLTCTHGGEPVVCYRYIVRRLTPLECERLQGYPDGWSDIGEWTDSNGKVHKTSDSARYKALGNSIALPPWKWVIKRLCACYERDATMASLFDGLGGFPYIWEQINGKGSCLWASEIEEFPMAVTKERIK